MNGQMMPGGIAGGQPQQPPQAPQAAPQPAPQMPPMGGGMPQMGGLGAMTPPMPQDQDLQTRLNKLMMMFQNPNIEVDRLKLLGEIDSTSKLLRGQQAMQQQMAMLQGQQAMAQGPVANQVLSQAQQLSQGIGAQNHEYAGGGLVAFAEGSGPLGVQQTFGYAPLYDEGRKYGIVLSPYDSDEARAAKIERIKKLREFDQYMEKNRAEIPGSSVDTAAKNLVAGYQDPNRAPRLDAPAGLAALRPSANDMLPPMPGGARPAARPPVPTAARAPMGPPRTTDADRMAALEPEYEAQSKRMQEFYQKQGQVDPELARLRQSAYELSETAAQRRETDRQAALQAAREQIEAPLIGNQEALLRMAGALGGAKRLGEGLSAAAGAAGAVRGEQRKAYEAAQKVSREEQVAIDTLKQALADKRVADRSGDVDRIRNAELNVEQAKSALLDKRFGIRKEVAAEADKAEQRRVAEITALAHQRQADAAMLSAQNRGAAASQITPYQMAQLRDKAIDNLSKDMPALIAKARMQASKTGQAFDEQTFRDSLIKQEIARIMGQPVPYDTPGASPGAAGQTVYDFHKIVAPKS